MASFPRHLLHICATGVILGWIGIAHAAVTVGSTILVLSRDGNSSPSGTSLLQGYSIPFEVVDLSQSGAKLPSLSSSTSAGNYGGIVAISGREYANGDDWNTVLSAQQWQQIYDYQETFGVRLVRLNAWPSADFGVSAVAKTAVKDDQGISITNSTGFDTAGLIPGVQNTLSGIAHYPAQITNSSIAFEVAQFAAVGSKLQKSTAAVVNKIGNREQQVWFTGFATDFSQASNFLSHAWVHWLTRGLYLGFRRVYFNTQVDDVFVETELYQSNKPYRVKAADFQDHVTWMKDINSRLPSGSSYKIELGHNGNGNIEAAVDKDYNNDPAVCNPQNGIEYATQIDGPPDYTKPIGTGKDLWPKNIKQYSWSDDCMNLDALLVWLKTPANRDAYFHVSHTFTHEDQTNATYADVIKEITWNQNWFEKVGFAGLPNFSPNGLIPPGITGLHNGDALRAWMENGIKYVVGDNSRPILMNVAQRKNNFWPVVSNVANNGYDGVTIVGRWGTSVYYNCDLPDCDVKEWIAVAGGKGTFDNLLAYEKDTNVKYLLGLRWDPFMFHQANMRVSDTSAITVNGVKGKYSLLMAWTEIILTELTRLTVWPVVTLKHDDIVTTIINRMTRDNCAPIMSYQLSDDKKSITGVTVAATNLKCPTPIPVTFPGPVKSTAGATKEQLGKDPLTLWVTLGGKAQSYTLSTPIAIR